MNNKKQQAPMTHKGKLSVLIAGAVLSMAASTSALAATTATTTPISVTSTATAAVIGHAPVMTKDGTVTATDKDGDGVLGTGDTLEASGFAFDDADGDKVTTSYVWYEGANVIKGETSDKLTLTKDMLGKTITVKAVANTDPKITEPAESTPVAAKTYIDIDKKTITGGTGVPTVSGSVVKAVTISGKAEVNEKLTATATCHNTCNGPLTYQWQIENTAGSGSYSDIKGATTKEYTVLGKDQKKKIKVIASTSK